MVWIIQRRIDSMFEVVELLVNVMGEKCKENQYGCFSQRSLRTQGKGERFKISKGRKSDDGDQRSEKATGFRVGARNDGFRILIPIPIPNSAGPPFARSMADWRMSENDGKCLAQSHGEHP
jgi:hypothetical protein